MKDVKDIYNVALVGCGWIGEDKHIPGLKANKDVKIRALCDIKPEKARRLAPDRQMHPKDRIRPRRQPVVLR